jgi:hypothetical protein
MRYTVIETTFSGMRVLSVYDTREKQGVCWMNGLRRDTAHRIASALEREEASSREVIYCGGDHCSGLWNIRCDYPMHNIEARAMKMREAIVKGTSREVSGE